MKIISVTPQAGEWIVTDSGEFPEHVRYAKDSWWRMMGTALEQCTYGDDEELEAAYQLFKSQ